MKRLAHLSAAGNWTNRSAFLCSLIVGASLLWVSATRAALVSWDSGFANNGYVPDGSVTGWSDTRTISGLGSEITDVNVSFTVSGGYNGDLYVYLAYGGQTAVLLNRVGRTSTSAFGYGDSGMNVVFNDSAAQTVDIHLYQTVSGYSITGGAEWRPDGRATDPSSVVATDSRNRLLSGFNGLNPNGSWTLFVADLSGGGTARITSWGLDISAVPEPVHMALPIFGGLLITAAAFRRRKVS